MKFRSGCARPPNASTLFYGSCNVMVNSKAKSATGRAATFAAAVCMHFGAGVSCVSLAMAQNATSLQCFRDDMRSADVRACAAMANAPGINANERSTVFAARGTAWLKEEEPAAAVADFTRALEFDPANVTAIAGRAKAYTLLLRHDLAAADWSHVISNNPDQPVNYRQRGASYLSGGRALEALEDFNKAIELSPREPEIYVERAGVYDRLNQRDKALKEFETAIGLDSSSWTIYLARAEAADRWGDRAMAIESYRLVIKHNGQYWNAYKALHRLGVPHAFAE